MVSWKTDEWNQPFEKNHFVTTNQSDLVFYISLQAHAVSFLCKDIFLVS